MKKCIPLVFFIGISQSAGIIGSVFTAPAIPTWYAALKKPLFTPPSWMFAPVWITLYALMGISAYLVWREGIARRSVRNALILFFVQLILNAAWSVVFFGFRSLAGGFIEIVFLWIAILFTTTAFYRISKPAAYLLLPYILWTTFASILNLSLLILNP